MAIIYFTSLFDFLIVVFEELGASFLNLLDEVAVVDFGRFEVLGTECDVGETLSLLEPLRSLYTASMFSIDFKISIFADLSTGN